MNNYESILQNLKFWDKLTQEEKQLLLSSIIYAKYKKGENIHGWKSNCSGMIYVASGNVRVYMVSEEGKEITLYRLAASDICMLSASCVLQSITFEVFVDAETDTDALIIGMKSFKEVYEKNIYLQNFALNVALQRFSDVMYTMQQILFMSLDKRIAAFLCDEIAKTNTLIVKLTHEQIAKYIGSARETVSRMLKYFADDGLVSVSRNGIEILDKKRLLQLTN